MAFRHKTRNNAAIGQVSSQPDMQSGFLQGTLSSKQRKVYKSGEVRDEILFDNSSGLNSRHRHHIYNTKNIRKRQNAKRSNTDNLHQKHVTTVVPDASFLPHIQENGFVNNTKNTNNSNHTHSKKSTNPKQFEKDGDHDKNNETLAFMLPNWKRWQNEKHYSKHESEKMRVIHVKKVKQDNSNLYNFLQPTTVHSDAYKLSLQNSNKMHKDALKLSNIQRKRVRAQQNKIQDRSDNNIKLTNSKKNRNGTKLPRISKSANQVMDAKTNRRLDKKFNKLNKNIHKTSEKQFEQMILHQYGTIENEYKLSKMTQTYKNRKNERLKQLEESESQMNAKKLKNIIKSRILKNTTNFRMHSRFLPIFRPSISLPKQDFDLPSNS